MSANTKGLGKDFSAAEDSKFSIDLALSNFGPDNISRSSPGISLSARPIFYGKVSVSYLLRVQLPTHFIDFCSFLA